MTPGKTKILTEDSYTYYASDIPFHRAYKPGDFLTVSILNLIDPEHLFVLDDEHGEYGRRITQTFFNGLFFLHSRIIFEPAASLQF